MDDFTVCGEAEDGQAAIEKAKHLSPDLILLDFSMPRMNGGQAAPILKKILPDVPIILFTLDEDSVNQALAAAICVDRVMAKSDGMKALVPCMRDVLGMGPKSPNAVGPLAIPTDHRSTPSKSDRILPDKKPLK
jgi:DNA-binding NarL/FixJ family response regulator